MPQGLNLRDRYELDRPLTDGRIASTYRGVAVDSGASVALKVLRASRLPEASARVDEAVELLERLEAAKLGAHARLYDFGTTDTGDLYLATGWEQGQPLLDTGRLHPAEALAAVRQAASLLQTFADHGLAHLNVRPDNLFVRADGQLALTGLGTGLLLPPDGVVEDDEYWAPELDLPPRGFRRDFWQADLFALARTALELLNAQVSGAATRVPHIRLPDGLESAFDSGPELCLLLEEALHESGDRRPASWNLLLDCLDRSLLEAPPERPSATEQAAGAMQSLREMWADGLSDIDLRSSGRSFDPRRTQKIPAIEEGDGVNVVLSGADGEIISAEQEITTEIRLPEPLAKDYVERRKPRSAPERRTAEKLTVEQPPPPAAPERDGIDEEIEELFTSHTATFELPAEALPSPQPKAASSPPPSQSVLTTSGARGPAIDWTRPGYAAKRSDPWESFRHLDWPRIGLAAGVLLALCGAFLLFRWLDARESPAVAPTRSAEAPLEIDTSRVARDGASDAAEPILPSSADSGAASASQESPSPAPASEEIAGVLEPEPDPSTPLESLVADLPEQLVPTTQIVSEGGERPDDAPAVVARIDEPASASSASSRAGDRSRADRARNGRARNDRANAEATPPRRARASEAPTRPASRRERPAREVTAERPRRTPVSEPVSSADPEQALLTRLDEALRGGDTAQLFAALADDDLAALKQTEQGRRIAVFAEIAAAGLESTERLLDSQDWSRALESANRLESQFPELARSSALRERAATGMERRADRLVAEGDFGGADRQLRTLRALWPERDDIDDKLRQLAGRRQQERNQRILAEVATAESTDRPHEALALLAGLEGQIPTDEYERRRNELSDQLARLDSQAPTVSLDPFDDASFVRGEPLGLQLQVQDDYEVVHVALRLRPAGSDDYLDVPIEKVGGRIYRADIPPSVHGSRKIGVWVRAVDRSGNVGELGTSRRPLRLKPRRSRAGGP